MNKTYETSLRHAAPREDILKPNGQFETSFTCGYCPQEKESSGTFQEKETGWPCWGSHQERGCHQNSHTACARATLCTQMLQPKLSPV